MRSRFAAFIGFCTLLLTSPALATPPVFQDLTLDEAIEKSVEADRLLIVDATAEWCGPCKQMDATTWVDPGVVSWIEENAIAIQVDVDEREAEAERLNIQAMPTLVIYREGEVFDRSVGFLDAETLSERMRMWDDGTTWLDKIAAEVDDGEGVDVEKRMDLAYEFASAGKNAEALKHYLWLWDNMALVDDEYEGMRGAYLASDMHDLAHEYEPAREAFLEMREALANQLREGAGYDVLEDWMSLNEALCDKNATLEWFDRVKDRENAAGAFDWFSYELSELLKENDRWADMALLYPNPIAQANRELGMFQIMIAGEDEDGDFVEFIREETCSSLADLYAACVAAGQDEDAATIRAMLIERFDDMGRITIVDRVLDAGVATPEHGDLLTRIDSPEATELRRRLAEAASIND